MVRLARYFKPYLLLILISIALLFVQAFADLALPDYLSRIVNVGIQQSGVENAVPVAIRQSEMDKLTLFMSPAEKTDILGHYTLVTQDSPDYKQAVQEYPALATEPVYTLKEIDKAEIERLNPLLGKAFIAVAGIQTLVTDPQKAAAMGAAMGFDLSKLPQGMDIFTVLGKLPDEQRLQISSKFNEQFAALGDKMIVQMAVAAVKAEYAALGLDTARTQNAYIRQTGLLMLLVTLLSVACTIASASCPPGLDPDWHATCAGMFSSRSRAFPAPSSISSPRPR